MLKLILNLVVLFIIQIVFLQNAFGKGSSIKFDDLQKADSLKRKALSLYFSNNDSSIIIYKQAYSLYISNDNLQGQMLCLSRLANLYSNTGRADTAIILAYKAIEIGELNQFDTLLAEAYLRMGNYYLALDKYNKAKEFYNKTIALNFSNTKNGAQASIGQVFLHQGKLDSAKYYLSQTLSYFEKMDSADNSNLYNRSSLNGSLGIIAFQQNNLKKGLAHLEESLRLSKKIGNSINIINSLISLSIGYDYLGKTDQAILSLNEALIIADSLNNNNYKLNIYKVYTEHYEELEEYKYAFQWTTIYHNLQDSLDKIDYNKIIYDNELSYSNKIKDEEHKRFIIEEKHSQLLLWISIVISSSLFMIILLLLYRKLRISILARKKIEISSVLMENKISKLKNNLSKLNIHLAEQNRRIANMQKTSNNNLNDKNINTFKELEQINIIRNEDWLKYKEIFELLFPNFLSRIVGQFPKLTEGDKRQLIMLKLGYSREKSASIIGITELAIKRGRQRLSKKIGLKDVTEFDDFINSF